MIKTLVFDLDDTLFSERQFALSGYKAVHEWQLPRLGLGNFLETAQQLYASPDRANLFNRTLNLLGVQEDNRLVDEMVRIFREHMPALDLHEDAQWALDHFKGRKKLAVISDGYLVPQQNKVKALNLEPYFEKIIYSESFGREFWKPHPRAFESMMESLGGEPYSFVYVADNPIKDFVAPKKLGWRTIQIERPVNIYYSTPCNEEQKPERVVHSLRELESILI